MELGAGVGANLMAIPCMCIESIKPRIALIKVIFLPQNTYKTLVAVMDAQNVAIILRNTGNNEKP